MRLKERIVRWIREQVKEAKAKGIVMGLSGGVDSSVVVTLAKEAMGDKLLVLVLPCHSDKKELKDARLIARKFKLKTKCVDLSNVYDRLIKILPEGNRIAQGNLKARLRMLILYYFANKLNYLVCGTGNKSEWLCGYFSKHGDGATDILPIGGLLKTQVRRLAKELGIPEYIITKPPTAGLWPGQTDEGEMGISYTELDDILNRMESKKRQVLPKEKVNKIKQMIKRSQHKREGPRIFHI